MIGDNRSFFLKSFRFLQQEVMASFRPCPDCAQKGVVSPIVPRRITEEVAIWKCNNASCLYPMSQSLEVFKAQFVPVSTVDERLFRRYVNYEVRSESCCSDAASVGGGVDPSPSPPFSSSNVVGVPSPLPLTGAAAPLPNGFIRTTRNVSVAAPFSVSAGCANANPEGVGVASRAYIEVTEPLAVNIGEETLTEERLAAPHAPSKKGRLITVDGSVDHSKVLPAQSPSVAQSQAPPVVAADDDDPTARRKRSATSSPAPPPPPAKRPSPAVDVGTSAAATGAGVASTATERQKSKTWALPQSAAALLLRWRRDKEAAAAAAAAVQAAKPPTRRRLNDSSQMDKVFVRSKLAKSLLPHSSSSSHVLQPDASTFASFQTTSPKPSTHSPTVIGQNASLPAGHSFPAYASSWRRPSSAAVLAASASSANNSVSDDGSTTSSSAASKNVGGGSLLSSAVKKTLKSSIISQLAQSPSSSQATSPPTTQLCNQTTPPTYYAQTTPPSSTVAPLHAAPALNVPSNAVYPSGRLDYDAPPFAPSAIGENTDSMGLVGMTGSKIAGAMSSAGGMDDAFGSAVDIFSPLDDIFGQVEQNSGDANNKFTLNSATTGSALLLTELSGSEPMVYQELGRINF